MSGTTAGLALALLASVALNGSYLLQHAGSARALAVTPRHPVRTLRSLLGAPVWALGAVAGFSGWGLHIAALSRAPISLVQAFVAGGLALVAPMAAVGLRHRLTRAERRAILATVLALPLLTLGLGGAVATRHHPAALAGTEGLLAATAAALAVTVGGPRRAPALAVAGGLLYGAADLAIKALTAGAGLRSPWLVVAAATTAGAFFAFQRALQTGRPVSVIALMTAATNVSTVLGGFLCFGDPLGRTPALAAVHLLAFGVIGLAAWGLAPAQARLSAGPAPSAGAGPEEALRTGLAPS